MVDEGEYASIRKLGTMEMVIGGSQPGNLLPTGYNWIRTKKAAEVLVNKSLLLGWFGLTQLGVN